MGFGGFGHTSPGRYLGYEIGTLFGGATQDKYFDATKVVYFEDDFSGDLSAYITTTAGASIVSNQLQLAGGTSGNRGAVTAIVSQPCNTWEYAEVRGTIASITGTPAFTLDFGDSEGSNPFIIGFVGLDSGTLRMKHGGSLTTLSGGWSAGDDLLATAEWNKSASPGTFLREMTVKAYVNATLKDTKTINVNVFTLAASLNYPPVVFMECKADTGSGSGEDITFDDIGFGFQDRS